MKRGTSRSHRVHLPKPIRPIAPRVAYPRGLAQSKPFLQVPHQWDDVLQGPHRAALEARLPQFLKSQRWFGSKAKIITSAVVDQTIPVPVGNGITWIAFVRVDYREADPERYLLPLAFASGPAALSLQRDHPHLIISSLHIADRKIRGVLYDAIGQKAFGRVLLACVLEQEAHTGSAGALVGRVLSPRRRPHSQTAASLEPHLVQAEQTNSAFIFEKKFFLKVFRKLETGLNPDLEVNQFLARRRFSHVPPLVGWLEYRPRSGEASSIGMLSDFVPNASDAWLHTLEALDQFYNRVSLLPKERRSAPISTAPLLPLSPDSMPPSLASLIGRYVKSTRVLGLRTAQMHVALASDSNDKAFAPERFTPSSLRSLCLSMRRLARSHLGLLRRQIAKIPKPTQRLAKIVAGLEADIDKRFQSLLKERIRTARMRTHGDYHLGQVLYTGKDFLIVDFEGEPSRPFPERRLKRSALRDVAGMLRSFHYAAYAALQRRVERGTLHARDLPRFEAWGRAWYRCISQAFLQAYLAEAAKGSFLPQSQPALARLLQAELLDKAMYELGYELNHRPGWVAVPLQAIMHLMEASS